MSAGQPCPLVIFWVDKNLPKPTVAPLQQPPQIYVTTSKPNFRDAVKSSYPKITEPKVDVKVNVPDFDVRWVSPSLDRIEDVDIPFYSAPNVPSAPDDPSAPPEVRKVEFDIPVDDVNVVYRDVVAELGLDVAAPVIGSIEIPDPPTIVISDPSAIPLIPLIEASVLLDSVIPYDLEAKVGKPVSINYKLFSVIDNSVYSEMVRNRSKLISFLGDLLSSIGVDVSKIAAYYSSLISLLSEVYSSTVAARNKETEINYWASKFRLQADVFSSQYRAVMNTFRRRVDVYRSFVAQVREYYENLSRAYSIGMSVQNSYVEMARSAVVGATRLMHRVSTLNNDIASAYSTHVGLVMKLVRRDLLEAELYRLQAEKAVQLYRLMELEALGEVADAHREALIARYNAVVQRFNAVREEARLISDIIEADRNKLKAMASQLRGEVDELEAEAKRIPILKSSLDREYTSHLVRLTEIYRSNLSNYLRKLEEYYNLGGKVDIANQVLKDDYEVTMTTVQSNIDTLHSELQADITRSYLQHQGTIAGARIMSEARIASTIIESYRA